ncbi:MAG: DMT family transporter [Rhodospirillales bacterium]|nr:DMT family transporter [Rhodospirillales bacterium]
MPPVFVLLWSTGFVGAKFGLPYAEPFTFLAMRLAIAGTVMTAIALYTRAPWPRRFSEVRDAVIVGVLLHGIYLGGVFLAISLGSGAGITAVITGLQPLLTATFAISFLKEPLSGRQILGLLIGLVGLVLVVWTGQDAGPWGGIIACFASLLGITVATLYQKRFGASRDLRTDSAIQMMAAFVLFAPLSLIFETGDVQWSTPFILTLAWLAIPMSIGTFNLLNLMIRWGAVARVTSVFYLVPPTVAIESWLLFGETLSLRQVAGMALAALGVALVARRKKA